ncbi:MAG: hypothetical protein C0173_05955 [Desulfurella sp.]|nr:MAG: hypothetical protein C0173_05955 [Desulfurella sp.]
MENLAGAGKAYNAKTLGKAVTQFGLPGQIITVAETAVVIAAHHFVAPQGGQQVKRRSAARKVLALYIKA